MGMITIEADLSPVIYRLLMQEAKMGVRRHQTADLASSRGAGLGEGGMPFRRI